MQSKIDNLICSGFQNFVNFSSQGSGNVCPDYFAYYTARAYLF